MNLKLSLLIISFIFLCSNCFAVTVPFTVESGYLIVPVKVRKNVSVEMLINTGLDTSIVDIDIAKKLKFGNPAYTSVGKVTGRNDETVVFYDISNVVLGGNKKSNLFVKASSFKNLTKTIGREIFGILGADYFQGKTVKFDFKNKTLSFINGTDNNKRSDKKSNIHRMKYSTTNKFGNKVTLPVSNKILINSENAKTLFDTGTPYPLLIMPSLVKKARLKKVDKNKTETQQINTLKISDFEVSDFSAIVFGKRIVPKMYDKRIDAVVGLGVMQNLSIIFDFDSELIIFD